MARGRPSKKQHITDTALTLFSQLGYQGTTIDQVVVAAAVSKPTVYSNFSSKQILWIHSLETILSVSEQELVALHEEKMHELQNGNCESDIEASLEYWLAIWYKWLASENRLAVYRIMLGENHKMEADSLALFQQFETLFMHYLDLSIADLPLSDEQKLVLFSVSRDQLLFPLLYRQSGSLVEEKEQGSTATLKPLLMKLITTVSMEK